MDKKKEKEKKEHDDFIARTVIDDDEPDFSPDDPHGRTRKHCWVYVDKGPRDLSDSFFIEPSTGRHYFISKDNKSTPYFGIEAIFNHKNYWINMDPSK